MQPRVGMKAPIMGCCEEKVRVRTGVGYAREHVGRSDSGGRAGVRGPRAAREDISEAQQQQPNPQLNAGVTAPGRKVCVDLVLSGR